MCSDWTGESRACDLRCICDWKCLQCLYIDCSYDDWAHGCFDRPIHLQTKGLLKAKSMCPPFPVPSQSETLWTTPLYRSDPGGRPLSLPHTDVHGRITGATDTSRTSKFLSLKSRGVSDCLIGVIICGVNWVSAMYSNISDDYSGFVSTVLSMPDS